MVTTMYDNMGNLSLANDQKSNLFRACRQSATWNRSNKPSSVGNYIFVAPWVTGITNKYVIRLILEFISILPLAMSYQWTAKSNLSSCHLIALGFACCRLFVAKTWEPSEQKKIHVLCIAMSLKQPQIKIYTFGTNFQHN